MKDSQLGENGKKPGAKYIKADNERFSTGWIAYSVRV